MRIADLIAAGRWSEARRHLAEALQLAPDDPELLHLAARVEYGAGDQREAERLVDRVLTLRPGHRGARRLRFSILVAARRHREALDLGRELLRLDPGDRALADALVELGVVTHWSSRPLAPFVRYGWGGSIALWVGAIVVLGALARVAPRLVRPLGLAYLVYVIYSWVQPPLVRRWLRWTRV